MSIANYTKIYKCIKHLQLWRCKCKLQNIITFCKLQITFYNFYLLAVNYRLHFQAL